MGDFGSVGMGDRDWWRFIVIGGDWWGFIVIGGDWWRLMGIR